MKRVLVCLVLLGIGASASAQTTKDSLPPVHAPPEMDPKATSTPAEPAPAPAAPAAPSAAANTAPTIPLGNSDAEAKAAAAAEAQATAERAKALASPTLPASDKPLESPGLPPEVQKAAEATELPVVTVRQQGNERVEEYRKRGKLYFVRVIPPEGPPRYYVDQRSDVPPNMAQLSAPSGVVQPVYFKLLEWH